MFHLFKIVYKVEKLNNESRYILHVTNPLAKKQLFYINIGIVLPQITEVFTPHDVQFNEVCLETNRVWKRRQIGTPTH